MTSECFRSEMLRSCFISCEILIQTCGFITIEQRQILHGITIFDSITFDLGRLKVHFRNDMRLRYSFEIFNVTAISINLILITLRYHFLLSAAFTFHQTIWFLKIQLHDGC